MLILLIGCWIAFGAGFLTGCAWMARPRDPDTIDVFLSEN